MRNEQVVACRRVFNAHPGIEAQLSGNVVTPVKGGVAGDPVTITDAMGAEAITKALKTSIWELENG
jgi:hypothetical protein